MNSTKNNVMKAWISASILCLFVSTLSGCGSHQTIIAPQDLDLKAGEKVSARTISYQDPIIWPKWSWWQNLTSTHPKRWDVVVFQPDIQKSELKALRVVGLPGEALRFEDGQVLVKDQPIDIPEALKGIQYSPGSFSVPSGHYFLLSDDPRQTNDSRKFGSIQRNAIRSRIESVNGEK